MTSGCMFDQAAYSFNLNVKSEQLNMGSQKMPVGIMCSTGITYTLTQDTALGASVSPWFGEYTTNSLTSRVNTTYMVLYANDNQAENRLIASPAKSYTGTSDWEIFNLAYYQQPMSGYTTSPGIDWGFTKDGTFSVTTNLVITY